MGCFSVSNHPAERLDDSHSSVNCFAYEFSIIINKVKQIFHGNNERRDRHHQLSQPRAASVSPGVTAEVSLASSFPIQPHFETEYQPSEQNVARIVNVDYDQGSNMSKEEEVLHAQTEAELCSKVPSQKNSCACLACPMTGYKETDFYEDYTSQDDADECPTCLEEYYPENPKIVTKCSHHFHLSCIIEWQQRSSECPVCFRVMEYSESK